jgi:hypothetical protein
VAIWTPPTAWIGNKQFHTTDRTWSSSLELIAKVKNRSLYNYFVGLRKPQQLVGLQSLNFHIIVTKAIEPFFPLFWSVFAYRVYRNVQGRAGKVKVVTPCRGSDRDWRTVPSLTYTTSGVRCTCTRKTKETSKHRNLRPVQTSDCLIEIQRRIWRVLTMVRISGFMDFVHHPEF